MMLPEILLEVMPSHLVAAPHPRSIQLIGDCELEIILKLPTLCRVFDVTGFRRIMRLDPVHFKF